MELSKRLQMVDPGQRLRECYVINDGDSPVFLKQANGDDCLLDGLKVVSEVSALCAGQSLLQLGEDVSDFS